MNEKNCNDLLPTAMSDDEVELEHVEFSDVTLHIDGFGSGVLGTGGVVWEAAYVILRYIEKWGCSTSFEKETSVAGKRVIDLSSGTGLVGIGAACLGANVTLSDVGDTLLGQIRANCDRNAKEITRGGGHIRVVDFSWGSSTAKLTRTSDGISTPFDLVLASDVLYCAIRDGIEDKLIHTLNNLISKASTVCVFGFKSRLPRKEKRFMKTLRDDFKLLVTEILQDRLDLSDIKPSNDGMFGSIFRHDDDCDMRVFFITRSS